VTLRSRRAQALAAVAVLMLTAAACGSDDDDAASTTTAADATTTTAAETTTTDAPSTTSAAGSEDAVTLEIAESDLGPILVSDGKTLYTFKPDDAGTPTCNDDCAAAWPPLLADGEFTVGDGLDGGLFSTVTRDDGGEQLTVDGWPLYFFANDAAPGDTNGQGIGDAWYVVGPDGVAIDDA
jgi:predicted lipoprotein with Yx(FWY)xxD motif